LSPRDIDIFYGPRRVALAADVDWDTQEAQSIERGPRVGAPEQAILGFLRKHNATEDLLTQRDGFWVLVGTIESESAYQIISKDLPAALKRFSWPKSMRWGQSADFTWIRPLRRMVCLLDGDIVPIELGPITAGNETEGHRAHARGALEVTSTDDWIEKLRDQYVIVNQDYRFLKIRNGIAAKAATLELTVVEDDGLLNEVTGLVEWPVPLIGKIDKNFMDLPPEVRELSMKVNQRYFALRDADGSPAPFFAFVSNIDAEDGGEAIIAGNERVLRARLSDAQHFWDLDLRLPLNEYLPKLDKITFHAKIGSQGDRVQRIARLSDEIALALGSDEVTAKQAGIAGLLSKADLVTGMVREFPELQGVIGGYYAEMMPPDWNGTIIGPAIKTHYQPKGPNDEVPTGTVAISLALADKLDTLVEFFRIREKPTGSGDPYALRRAALGVIRIITENDIRLPLRSFLGGQEDLFGFIIDRLRVKLRNEGNRFDILDAVLAAGINDDLVKLLKRVDALGEMLSTEDGMNLHAAYKRAASILRIEDGEKKLSNWIPNWDLLKESAEIDLAKALNAVRNDIVENSLFEKELYKEVMSRLSSLRLVIDAFFEKVTVNDPTPEIRQNRLRLLAQFCKTVEFVADFSKIEG
jgi:glycyl-tRNA synthetase beta chain